MLEEIKAKGDLIAAHRPTPQSAYIEGVVNKVYQDGDDYFYEVVWEDGKHFGEAFYEGELDEIDLDESEATVRVFLSEFLSEEGIDEWLNIPNGKLHGLSPFEALETLGLNRVAQVAIDDYSDALREEESFEEFDEDELLEEQLGDILGQKPEEN